jgi:hypothetical protein
MTAMARQHVVANVPGIEFDVRRATHAETNPTQFFVVRRINHFELVCRNPVNGVPRKLSHNELKFAVNEHSRGDWDLQPGDFAK